VIRLEKAIARDWPATLTAALGMATFGALGFWVHNGPMRWDSTLWRALSRYRNTHVAAATLHMSHDYAGTYGVAASIVLIAATLLLLRRNRAALFFCSAMIVIVSVPVLKDGFHRRPPVPSTERYSFPSGHAISSAALVAAVVVLLWQSRWRWVALIAGSAYAIAIGAAVVLDRGHWPSDVVAGWGLATAWVVACAVVIRPHPVSATAP
jgi:undecaprenyl-diphosphatase